MVIAVVAAPMRVQVGIPAGPATEGQVLDVRVRGVAERALVVTSVQVELVRSETWRYREANLYGGQMTVPAKADAVVVTQVEPGPGPIPAAGELDVRTSLLLPAACLGTASGRLVEVAWRVRVRVRIDGHPPAEASRAITVLSRAVGRAAVAQAEPVVLDRGCAVLAFEHLSDRRVRAGATVTGELVVTPWRRTLVTGVRVELVLRERVHHGRYVYADPTKNPANQEREHDTVISGAAVSGRVLLEPGHPLRLPFGIPVPGTLAATSMDTPEFTVGWLLRGSLPRPLRPAPRIEVELHAATAP